MDTQYFRQQVQNFKDNPQRNNIPDKSYYQRAPISCLEELVHFCIDNQDHCPKFNIKCVYAIWDRKLQHTSDLVYQIIYHHLYNDNTNGHLIKNIDFTILLSFLRNVLKMYSDLLPQIMQQIKENFDTFDTQSLYESKEHHLDGYSGFIHGTCTQCLIGKACIDSDDRLIDTFLPDNYVKRTIETIDDLRALLSEAGYIAPRDDEHLLCMMNAMTFYRKREINMKVLHNFNKQFDIKFESNLLEDDDSSEEESDNLSDEESDESDEESATENESEDNNSSDEESDNSLTENESDENSSNKNESEYNTKNVFIKDVLIMLKAMKNGDYNPQLSSGFTMNETQKIVEKKCLDAGVELIKIIKDHELLNEYYTFKFGVNHAMKNINIMAYLKTNLTINNDTIKSISILYPNDTSHNFDITNEELEIEIAVKNEKNEIIGIDELDIYECMRFETKEELFDILMKIAQYNNPSVNESTEIMAENTSSNEIVTENTKKRKRKYNRINRKNKLKRKNK